MKAFVIRVWAAVLAVAMVVRRNAIRIAVAMGVGGGVLALTVGVSGATTYNPTTALTAFADSFGTLAGPIVLAVGTAFVGLAILFWGLRFAFGFVGTRIRH